MTTQLAIPQGAQIPAPAVQLPLCTPRGDYILTSDEEEANEWLRLIRRGKIGLDTEYVHRTPSQEELTAMSVDNSRTAQLQFHRQRWANGHEIDWDAVGTCLVQVARGNNVLIMDIKRMRGKFIRFVTQFFVTDHNQSYPRPFASYSDEQQDHQSNRWRRSGRSQLLARFRAERLWYGGGCGLSLKLCVQDVFHLYLDKDLQSTDWTKDVFTHDEIVYAGLDAQVSLDLHEEMEYELRQKELRLGRIISNDWYTFNFVDGVAERIIETFTGHRLPWNGMLCPWYQQGVYQGCII
ncbi:hypothetical protein C8J57DRAFT_1468077 [Mycena rebaudengoi]|nr:hypothetical protein C8J57DRAFT_1468077 [Mycena rebaudengoi]